MCDNILQNILKFKPFNECDLYYDNVSVDTIIQSLLGILLVLVVLSTIKRGGGS